MSMAVATAFLLTGVALSREQWARQHIPGGANVNVSLAGRDLIVGVSLGDPPVTIDPGSAGVFCFLLFGCQRRRVTGNRQAKYRIAPAIGGAIQPSALAKFPILACPYTNSVVILPEEPGLCPRLVPDGSAFAALGWTRSPANCAQSASGPPRPQVPHKAATVVWSTATRFGVQQAVT